MKDSLSKLFILSLILTIWGSSSLQAQNDGVIVPGQFFVKTYLHLTPNEDKLNLEDKKNEQLKLLAARIGIEKVSKPFILDNPTLQSTFLIEFSERLDADSLLEEINSLPLVEYVEKVPNYGIFFTPNDPQFSNQWHLQKIQAQAAWDLHKGSANVVIAIVDDAVDLNHPDLSGKIWTNPGEIPGNSIDDDGNGYIDDVNGWDAADNDNNATPPAATVSNSNFTHGTHVAGIAAGATDNLIGISSIGFNCQIMPVKTKRSSSSGSSLQAPYQGVQYAIASNADVINMSWGGTFFSLTYQALFNQAYLQNITCVAAAGNSNSPFSFYPAAYNHVISVAATNPTDTKASFSNYGTTIDISAPGTGIVSTLAGLPNKYGPLSGTSMASPMVAGLVGLMISLDPFLIPDDLESCLKSSSFNIDALNPTYSGLLGAGRIDAEEALKCVNPNYAEFTSDFTQICPGGSVQFTDLSSNSPTSWQWSFPGGVPTTSNSQNPSIAYAAAGNYNVTLIISHSLGIDTLTKTAYINVATPSGIIGGGGTVLLGYQAALRMDFTGVPPWNFTYTDGTNNWTISGVTTSPYFFSVSPALTTTYTLVSMNDSMCAGTFSGSALVTVMLSGSNSANCISVKSWQKISDTQGNFTAILDNDDQLGREICPLGDQDGDGIIDIAIGAPLDDDGGLDKGAFYMMYMNANGTVNSYQKISETAGNFTGTLDATGSFGFSISAIGDLNNDGVDDLAVGEPRSNDGGTRRGAVWVLFMNANGTVNAHQKISDIQGNFTGVLDNDDRFGESITALGDLNNDGVEDIAVGTGSDDDGGLNRGAVWVLFLNPNGTVNSYQKISDTQGGFTGTLDNNDQWGDAIKNIGDFDNDGVNDLAVGARKDDDGGLDKGAIWLILLNTNGTVKNHYKISDTQGNFSSHLDNNDNYGLSIAAMGDLNYDGVLDIAVGAPGDDDGGTDRGAFYILYLNSSGAVAYSTKISSTTNGFTGSLSDFDSGGAWGLEMIGDLNSDGFPDIAFGAAGDDDGGSNRGATYIINLHDPCQCANGNSITFQKVIGGSGDDRAHSVISTLDGGYMVVGETDSWGAGGLDIFLLKLDSMGNRVWLKTYGGSNDDGGSSASVVQTADSGFAFIGYTRSYGGTDRDLWVVKVSKTGTMIWQKHLGGSGDDRGRGITTTKSGGILISGSIGSFGPGGDDAYIAKLNGNGVFIWGKTYGAGSADHFTDLKELYDGTIVAVGHFRSYGLGTYTGLLMKTDALGNVIWNKIYDGAATDGLNSFDTTRNGGFILVGNTRSWGAGGQDILVVKTDSSGNLEWSNTYGGLSEERGVAIRQLADESYIVSGNTLSFGFGSKDILNFKIDNYGNIISAYTLGSLGYDDSGWWGKSISITNDGGYIYSGFTDGLLGPNEDIYIIKFNPCDKSFCNQDSIGLIRTNITPFISSPILGVVAGGAAFNSSASITLPNPSKDSIICAASPNDPCGPNTATTFQKILGGTGHEEGHSIIQTLGGGFAIAGITNSWGAGNMDWTLTRLDQAGSLLWTKAYGGTSVEDGWSMSIVQTSDSGFAIIGNTRSFGANSEDILIAKVDLNGNIIWQKIFSGGGTDLGRSIIESKSGALYLAGTAGAGNQDPYVMKLDKNGNSIWKRRYAVGGGADHITDIIETTDGNFMITGHFTSLGAGPSSAYVAKIDSLGTIIWDQLFDDSSNDAFIGMTQTYDGGYAMVGLTASFGAGGRDVYVVKIDSAGNFIWSKTYGGSADDRGIYIIESPSHELFFTARTYSFGAGNADILLIRTDEFGNVISSRTFGTANDDFIDYWGDNLTLTNDGGAALVGRTNGFKGPDHDMWVIKVNACQKTFCNDMDISLIANSITPGILYPTLTSSSIFTVSTPTLSVTIPTASQFLDSIICSIIPVPACDIIADFSSDTVCAGDTTSFTDLTIDTIAVLSYWHWNFGDGDSITGIQNPKHIYTSGGTFIVKLIVGDNSIPACFDTIIKTVEILSGWDIDPIPNDTICKGDSLQLSISLQVCSGNPFTYSWAPTNGLSNPNISNPKASPANTTTYTVTVTDNLFSSQIGTVTVAIDTSCCVPFAKIGGDNFICEGAFASFQNLSVAKPNATYFWNFGPNAVPNSFAGTTPPPILYPTTGSYPVQLILIDSCGTDTANHFVNISPLPLAFAGNDTALCLDDSVYLGNIPIAWHVYSWSPTSGLNNPNIANPISFVTGNISYIVTHIDSVTGCSTSDTINILRINSPTVSLPADTSFCFGDTLSILSDTTGSGIFQWENGFNNTLRFISQPGISWSQISNFCGVARDSIILDTIPSPFVSIPSDSFICPGAPITITAVYSGAGTFIWEDLSVIPARTFALPGIYWAENSNACGTYRDSIDIVSIANTTVQLPPDTFLCSGDTLFIIATQTGSGSLTWDDTSIGSHRPVIYAGNYWVIARNECGTDSDTIRVDSILPLVLELPKDTLICPGVQLNVTPTLANQTLFYWHDNSTNSGYIINSTATIWLYAENQCESAVDTMLITAYQSQFLNIGPDTSLCPGFNIVLNSNIVGNTYIWQDGSLGSSLTAETNGFYWLMVATECEFLTDSLMISELPVPSPGLGPDLEICHDEEITISPGGEYLSYFWNTGSSNQSISVGDGGVYWVDVSNNEGCHARDSIEVTEEICNPGLFIPNAFSPNGDGLNDEFFPVEKGITVFEFLIFDRWGKLIFEGKSANDHWNGTFLGKDVSEGVYTWAVGFLNPKKDKDTIRGTVSLIR